MRPQSVPIPLRIGIIIISLRCILLLHVVILVAF